MEKRVTGFLFAAGLGTRLLPLTATRPKALVRYQGKTLLDNALDKMFSAGIDEIIVNVHHFPDMMLDALRTYPEARRIRISDERAYLRDTAGGLKFAEPLWGKSDLLLLYNVDILSNIDLRRLVEFHVRHDAEATLAVRNRTTARYFLFEPESMQLCGWRNVKTGEQIGTNVSENVNMLAFSGIHVINTDFARSIPSVEKSSITGFYLSNVDRRRILGYEHDEDEWCDVGKFSEFHNLLT